jgi:hypothetical protein
METHKTKMAGKEDAIRTQLQQGNEAAALSLAETFAQQESWLETQQQQHEQLAAYEQRLLHTLKTAASKLEHYTQRLWLAGDTQADRAARFDVLHQHCRAALEQHARDRWQTLERMNYGA